MRSIYSSLIVGILLLLSQHSVAEEIRLQYPSFYDHLDQVEGEAAFSKLQMRFSFIDDQHQVCQINKAEIRAPDYLNEPIALDVGEYLQLPYNKGLDIEKAIVAVDLDNIHCRIKVQVAARESQSSSYDLPELLVTYQQLSTFMDDMGGMFSFLMPKTQGLVIHMPNSEKNYQAELAGKSLALKENKVYITEQQLQNDGLLNLSHPSKLITAWMK